MSILDVYTEDKTTFELKSGDSVERHWSPEEGSSADYDFVVEVNSDSQQSPESCRHLALIGCTPTPRSTLLSRFASSFRSAA